ncbi:MAG TPA: galactokinase family protein, partial [Chitinophagaceae bacterium]|nr:galactokinase family protein [Chitinophagaceae bacterium]
MSLADKVKQKFQQEFGGTPRVFSAPGRVNIIGEHTDYNGGLVLPAAIDKAAYLAVGPANGNIGRWVSADFSESVEIDFNKIANNDKSWPNYVLGIIDQFRKDGKQPSAFNAVLAADVPIGAGLSSSAAIETVVAYAINEIDGFGYNKIDLALLAQRAEHEYIGVKVGIMDMFASLHGQEGHVMRLDCRSLDFEYVPVDLGNYKIVLFDTGVKHELASSEYNVRRQQCEEGVKILSQYHPEVKQLRDVTTEMLETRREEMDP